MIDNDDAIPLIYWPARQSYLSIVGAHIANATQSCGTESYTLLPSDCSQVASGDNPNNRALKVELALLGDSGQDIGSGRVFLPCAIGGVDINDISHALSAVMLSDNKIIVVASAGRANHAVVSNFRFGVSAFNVYMDSDQVMRISSTKNCTNYSPNAMACATYEAGLRPCGYFSSRATASSSGEVDAVIAWKQAPNINIVSGRTSMVCNSITHLRDCRAESTSPQIPATIYGDDFAMAITTAPAGRRLQVYLHTANDKGSLGKIYNLKLSEGGDNMLAPNTTENFIFNTSIPARCSGTIPCLKSMSAAASADNGSWSSLSARTPIGQDMVQVIEHSMSAVHVLKNESYPSVNGNALRAKTKGAVNLLKSTPTEPCIATTCVENNCVNDQLPCTQWQLKAFALAPEGGSYTQTTSENPVTYSTAVATRTTSKSTQKPVTTSGQNSPLTIKSSPQTDDFTTSKPSSTASSGKTSTFTAKPSPLTHTFIPTLTQNGQTSTLAINNGNISSAALASFILGSCGLLILLFLAIAYVWHKTKEWRTTRVAPTNDATIAAEPNNDSPPPYENAVGDYGTTRLDSRETGVNIELFALAESGSEECHSPRSVIASARSCNGAKGKSSNYAYSESTV